MYHEQIKNGLFCYFLFLCVQAPGNSGNGKDDRLSYPATVDLAGSTTVSQPSPQSSTRRLVYSHIILFSKPFRAFSTPCNFFVDNARSLKSQTTQDMPSTRANTLSDDADDIQKQLDNEAKDRIKFARPQTIWILHYPTDHRISTSTEEIQKSEESKALKKRITCPCNKMGCDGNFTYTDIVSKFPAHTKGWNYTDQHKWKLSFPACGGRSQSPVNLPFRGLLRTKAPRQMLFSRYDVVPKSMKLVRREETVALYGNWGCDRPFIYGGAAHSRRYVFHSLAVRRPSEHTIGGLYYPMETQAIHISVEYATLEDAIKAASKDKLSLLVVSNIYKHANYSHLGLKELVNSVISKSYRNINLNPLSLDTFCPPLEKYAAYHGSLTTPPCTESILWLVRAKPLPIARELVDVLENGTYGEPGKSQIRLVQPLNDRTIYFFN